VLRKDRKKTITKYKNYTRATFDVQATPEKLLKMLRTAIGLHVI
jgi:hypothetical protein